MNFSLILFTVGALGLFTFYIYSYDKLTLNKGI